jgi:hypothetical protein
MQFNRRVLVSVIIPIRLAYKNHSLSLKTVLTKSGKPNGTSKLLTIAQHLTVDLGLPGGEHDGLR